MFGKKPQKTEPDEQEANIRLFINDVLAAIDNNAPCFKTITIECEKRWSDNDDNENILIVDADDKKLKYNYAKHGFAVPSNEAKKRLAVEIAQKYNGVWFEDTIDDSEGSVTIKWIRIIRYRIIAHEALDKMNGEKRYKDSLRKC